MKFKLNLGQSSLAAPKGPTSAAGTGPRKELKKFKAIAPKQQSRAETDAAGLELIRHVLGLRLETLSDQLEYAVWSIENLDNLWTAAQGGSFKDKNACRTFLLTFFRTLRTQILEGYTVGIQYMLWERGPIAKDSEYSKVLSNQIYMLDTVLEPLVMDKYTEQFVIQAVDQEREKIVALFRKAFTSSDPAKVLPIVDSWCSSGVSRLIQLRLGLSNEELKEWFTTPVPTQLASGPVQATPLPVPSVHGHASLDFDEQPAATVIPLIEESALEADCVTPPPLDASQIKPLRLDPSSFTPELYTAVSSYYQDMGDTDIFPRDSDSSRRVYEGWTKAFETERQCAQDRTA